MLQDKDRIFTNLYGLQGPDLRSAMGRGDWDRTKDLIARGRDWIVSQVKDAIDLPAEILTLMRPKEDSVLCRRLWSRESD